MFRITLLRLGEPEHEVVLGDRTLRIGRGAGNEITLRDPDKTTSRVHAEVRREGNQWVFIDNDSQNGCWIEGRRVDRVVLRHGVVIAFGDYELVCEAVDAARADDETRLRHDVPADATDGGDETVRTPLTPGDTTPVHPRVPVAMPGPDDATIAAPVADLAAMTAAVAAGPAVHPASTPTFPDVPSPTTPTRAMSGEPVSPNPSAPSRPVSSFAPPADGPDDEAATIVVAAQEQAGPGSGQAVGVPAADEDARTVLLGAATARPGAAVGAVSGADLESEADAAPTIALPVGSVVGPGTSADEATVLVVSPGPAPADAAGTGLAGAEGAAPPFDTTPAPVSAGQAAPSLDARPPVAAPSAPAAPVAPPTAGTPAATTAVTAGVPGTTAMQAGAVVGGPAPPGGPSEPSSPATAAAHGSPATSPAPAASSRAPSTATPSRSAGPTGPAGPATSPPAKAPAAPATPGRPAAGVPSPAGKGGFKVAVLLWVAAWLVVFGALGAAVWFIARGYFAGERAVNEAPAAPAAVSTPTPETTPPPTPADTPPASSPGADSESAATAPAAAAAGTEPPVWVDTPSEAAGGAPTPAAAGASGPPVAVSPAGGSAGPAAPAQQPVSGGGTPAVAQPPATVPAPGTTAPGSPGATPAPTSPRPPRRTAADRAREAEIERRYNAGRVALAEGRALEARDLLAGVAAESPGYKGVDELLRDAESAVRREATAALAAADGQVKAGEFAQASASLRRAEQYGAPAGELAAVRARLRAAMTERGAKAFADARQFDGLGRNADAIRLYQLAVDLLPEDDPRRAQARQRLEALGAKRP